MAAKQIAKSQRNKNGTFVPGNNGNPHPLPGPGVKPIRERFRDRLRYRWEADPAEQPKVAMTRADSHALKALRTLDGMKDDRDFISSLKSVEEMAYGKDITSGGEPLKPITNIERVIVHKAAP